MYRTTKVVLLLGFCCAKDVVLQPLGSGTNGNLRLCVVEGRGSYKRVSQHCPVLDSEDAGVECVIGIDRLDCLRRISKGTVDFATFSPEDLVAAQWAEVDVLVSSQLKLRARPFAQTIVAVVNRRVLLDVEPTISSVLRNRTLCRPTVDVDDLRPLSETLVRYLETLVTAGSCDPALSLTENRIKVTAEFFGRACRAGSWVPDATRDAELKRKYPQLCSACSTGTCASSDPYWGDSGALTCLAAGAGDVTWAERDDVLTYFKTNGNADQFAFLCRDGSWRPLDGEPCPWLQRPWNIIVSKRKAVLAVAALTSTLANNSVTVDRHWRGSLAALLETNQALPAPLQPPLTPLDYLATAIGFREAYSQHGCDPPRHISVCTTSIIEHNKCEWLSEAGAVHGVAPPLQCARRGGGGGGGGGAGAGDGGARACLSAVAAGDCDVVVADSDWLVVADRNYSLTPVLHEANPIFEKTSTVFAFVRKDANLTKMADLRGKRASFPRFDGVAWHSVFNYLKQNEKSTCKDVIKDFFGEICSPGIEKYIVGDKIKEDLSKNCFKEGGNVLEGEEQALRSLVEGRSDVAFVSLNTIKMYRTKQIQEPWARQPIEITPICPQDNPKYCFISWANVGHVFAAKNLTALRRHEIVNVFTKLDQLFGRKHVHSLTFSMYGMFNHQMDVLFHNNTRYLATDDMYKMSPYKSLSTFSFERTVYTSSLCQVSDVDVNLGAKLKPTFSFLISLFAVLKLFNYYNILLL